MASIGLVLTMFDLIFVPLLWISVMCVAAWNRYDFSENVYTWMEVDFFTGILIRLLRIMDLCLAEGIGLDFSGQPRCVRICVRVVVLSTLCILLYPFLLAWTIIGAVLFISETGLPPEGGQKWCFLMFWVISYGELCYSPSSCVAKVRDLLPTRVSRTERVELLADSERASVTDQGTTGIVEP